MLLIFISKSINNIDINSQSNSQIRLTNHCLYMVASFSQLMNIAYKFNMYIITLLSFFIEMLQYDWL
jgi:hypothetical protein